MSKDEIQTWMLLAFLLALFFSFYKVYLMFNKPGVGIDTATQKDELVEIVQKSLVGLHCDDFDATIVYEKIISEDFDWSRYSNFNLNRCNQTIELLLIIHECHTIEALLLKLSDEA